MEFEDMEFEDMDLNTAAVDRIVSYRPAIYVIRR
jgi:hypothetical protein